MAHYTPDYKLREAQEFIDSLDNSKESDLIRYFIKKKDEHIEYQDKKLKEYSDFFELLDKLLPNINTIIR